MLRRLFTILFALVALAVLTAAARAQSASATLEWTAPGDDDQVGTAAQYEVRISTSLITAASNDFGFDQIFARQVEALAQPGDLLVIHSTSGNSPNVLLAAEAARAKGISVLSFSARDGGKLRDLSTHSVIIPTQRTDRAQELHLCIEHLICELVEQSL